MAMSEPITNLYLPKEKCQNFLKNKIASIFAAGAAPVQGANAMSVRERTVLAEPSLTRGTCSPAKSRSRRLGY